MMTDGPQDDAARSGGSQPTDRAGSTLTGSNGLLYIRVDPESKRPVDPAWGGYSLDPDHPGVYQHEQVAGARQTGWAVAGNRSGTLVIIDSDTHKMNEDRKAAYLAAERPATRTVSTQNDGSHEYYRLPAGIDPADIEIETEQYVDLKGDVGKGYAVAPTAPGYDLVSDRPATVLTPGELESHPGIKHVTIEPDGADDQQSGAGPTGDSYPSGGWKSLSAYDIVSRAEYPAEQNHAAPSWMHDTPSETGTNFRLDGEGATFRCWRHGCTGHAGHLLGIECGIIECGEWDRNGLDADTWREVTRYAVEEGYLEPAVHLPAVDVLDLSWQYDDLLEPTADGPARCRSCGDLFVHEAGVRAHVRDSDCADALGPEIDWEYLRQRRREILRGSADGSGPGSIVAMPAGARKSSDLPWFADYVHDPTTALVHRGNEGEYEDHIERFVEFGFERDDIKLLPALTRTCPSIMGEHGEAAADRMKALMGDHVQARRLHDAHQDRYGEPAPCDCKGSCPYRSAWDFDPDDYAVLIGHPSHANVPSTIAERHAVFDEFGNGMGAEGPFDEEFENPAEAASAWLAQEREIPVDSVGDLRFADSATLADVQLALDARQSLRDDEFAIRHRFTAHAPALAYAILLNQTKDRERHELTEDVVAYCDPVDATITLTLRPPGRRFTESVTALDASARNEMRADRWRHQLGLPLEVQGLTDAQFQAFHSDLKNQRFVGLDVGINPALSGEYLHPETVGVIADRMSEQYDVDEAAVLSSLQGREPINDLDAPARASGLYYGNANSSNDEAATKAGIVHGAYDPSDAWVRKVAGKLDIEYRPPLDDDGDRLKGENRSYGEADAVLDYFRETRLYQLATRPGRTDDPSTVVLNTSVRTPWLPTIEAPAPRLWADGYLDVIEAVNDLGANGDWLTVQAVVDHLEDPPTRQHVNRVLNELTERNVLEKQDHNGRTVEYRLDFQAADSLSEFGEVELPELEHPGYEAYTRNVQVSTPTPGDNCSSPSDRDDPGGSPPVVGTVGGLDPPDSRGTSR